MMTSDELVYVSLCGGEYAALRADLCAVLGSAGIKALPDNATATAGEDIGSAITASTLAVFVLFPDVTMAQQGGGLTLLEHQYRELMRRKEQDAAYRLIIWLPPSSDLLAMPPGQLAFVNQVRNSISANMVFSNAHSALQLVDDLRSLLEVKEETTFDVKETEIFLVYNQLDESEAAEVKDMLMDIVPVENLNIIQDSDMDYSEYCSQQIGKSKLAVVYFKESAEWALPFAQQVWKKIGGASSHVPILLIGDEDPDTNMNKKLKAPKIISLIVAGELIPLEIKVQYDKVTELLKK